MNGQTSILLSRIEGMLESTSRCVKKSISSFLDQTHQFSKRIMEKSFHYSLHIPIGNTLDSRSRRLVSASALPVSRRSQSPSDAEVSASYSPDKKCWIM